MQREVSRGQKSESVFLRRLSDLMARLQIEPLRTAMLSILVALIAAYSSPFDALTVPNERSRLYLSVAIVDHCSFAIDEVVQRFGPILDLAQHGGHLYSDKAPGSSLLGALLYGTLRLFTSASRWEVCELLTWMRLAGVLPLSILGFVLLRQLLQARGASRGVSDLVSLAWFLASPVLHYSVALYGHQLVSVFSLAALWLLDRAERNDTRSRVLLAALAGLSVAAMVLTEYQASLIALCLVLYVLVGPLRHSSALLAAFLGCSALGGGLLLVYNSLCFGGTFELSYQHLVNPQLSQLHGVGVAGVTVPSGAALAGILLSLHRGLLVAAPWVLCSLAGSWVLFRRGAMREVALLGGTFLGYLLFVGSSNAWVGGWSYGPRLLLPVLGWVALLAAPGISALGSSRLSAGLMRGSVLAGLLSCQAIQVCFSEPPPESENPLVDIVAPAMEAGLVGPNLANRLGVLGGLGSLLPLLALLLVAVIIILRADLQGIPTTVQPQKPARQMGRTRHLEKGGIPATVQPQEPAAAPAGIHRQTSGDQPLAAIGRARLRAEAVVAAACVAFYLAAVVFAGPGLTATERQRFLDFVERLSQLQHDTAGCPAPDL